MNNIQQKTVLITGASGFIGRALCNKMLQDGWKVRAIVRHGSKNASFAPQIEIERIHSIENLQPVEISFSGVDVVVHLAARVHVPKTGSGHDEALFYKINTEGTERLARLAAKNGVKRFIYLSTIKVNGEGLLRPYTEEDIPAPSDIYGSSKLNAEKSLMQIASETGLEAVILRPPLVYGPGVQANFAKLIKIIKLGLPLPFKKINNLRSFIYIGNLVDIISICSTHPMASGRTFLVSDGNDVSLPGLITMIGDKMNKKSILFTLNISILNNIFRILGRYEDLQKLTGNLRVDSSKIRDLLGWIPPYSLEDGIRETVINGKANF